MPIFAFFTSFQGPGIPANMGLDAAASTFVAQGAIVASTDNGTVITGSGANQVVTIAGQVWTRTSNAIALLGDFASVSVLSTGSVLNSSAGWTAALMLSDNSGSTNTLNNAGQIVGGGGVFASGNFNILNSGRIASQGGGSVLESNVSAALLLNTSVQVSGLIDNTGTIEGSVQNAGNFLAGRMIAVMETTTIGDSSAGFALSINNSGSILGDLVLGRREDVVKNTGLIDGTIDTGVDNDSVKNAGSITGDVLLGGGNDLYDGRAGTIDGAIYGGDGHDKLYAGAGDNEIYGQAGDDTMIGGIGRDAFSGGTGTDRVSYSTATTGVTVQLAKPGLNKGDAKGDTFSSVEEIVGSHFNDILIGTSSANRFWGGEGDDSINGALGNDRLSGGDENDTFVFNTALNASNNVDTITDFNVADDRIQIDNAVFLGLPTGALAAAAFRASTTGNAADATDHILYETDTGKLFFDANGNAAGAKIHFATLTAGLALTSADFIVN